MCCSCTSHVVMAPWLLIFWLLEETIDCASMAVCWGSNDQCFTSRAIVLNWVPHMFRAAVMMKAIAQLIVALRHMRVDNNNNNNNISPRAKSMVCCGGRAIVGIDCKCQFNFCEYCSPTATTVLQHFTYYSSLNTFIGICAVVLAHVIG